MNEARILNTLPTLPLGAWWEIGRSYDDSGVFTLGIACKRSWWLGGKSRSVLNFPVSLSPGEELDDAFRNTALNIVSFYHIRTK